MYILSSERSHAYSFHESELLYSQSEKKDPRFDKDYTIQNQWKEIRKEFCQCFSEQQLSRLDKEFAEKIRKVRQ